jgi:UDP-3-O-[3-hydroxymyristoyl] glucosamine N-acyltransferase
MADPRFFDNRGPFTLAQICAAAGAALPDGAVAAAPVHDVASLSGAAPEQLSFFTGGRNAAFVQTSAGFCFIPADYKGERPAGTVLIPVASPQHAFIAVAMAFYPECLRLTGPLKGIDPTARIGKDVEMGEGVVIGPGAEIGEGTHLGPHTVIGRGVAIGRNCEIAGNTTIVCAYIGDQVAILPGAQIGQPGFGFASGPQGHLKVPQLGRVIIQDKVEIGACTTLDRGALGDTVVGEGSKIDNLVQIGHNSHIGRHTVIVGQAGVSGSASVGDFVVVGGQSGISDHSKIGDGARLAGRTALISGQEIEGGKDYGGVPAKPVKDWIREIYTLSSLTRKPKKGGHD